MLTSASSSITATVTVKNTGIREGKEAVLWFLFDEVGSIARPVRDLKYYEKKMVEVGERRTERMAVAPAGLTLPEVAHHLVILHGVELHYVTAETTGLSRLDAARSLRVSSVLVVILKIMQATGPMRGKSLTQAACWCVPITTWRGVQTQRPKQLRKISLQHSNPFWDNNAEKE